MTILDEDIQNIIKDFDMSVFKDKTILVTGATGLIGKLCVKSLLNSGYNIKVIALVRNPQKAEKIFGANQNLQLLVQDINDEIRTDIKADYIIHGASVTSSADFVNKPVETIMTAINGTKNILEYAKTSNIKGMVYLSSLEVYGIPANANVKENDYGFIDILNPRSSYSEGKKIVETLCSSYASEYNVPVKIARLSQTFGAGVDKNDNRVFAQFVKSVINKENIILHTKGETARNYCYTTDAIRAIFTVLSKGETAQAYNIANKNTYITIADMAKLLENEHTKVVFEIDGKNRGFNPTMQICLNTDKLEQLNWSAKIDLVKMFERTIKSMQEE